MQHSVPLPADVSHAPLDVLHINFMWISKVLLDSSLQLLCCIPLPFHVCGYHADHNCHNKDSVAGVAHVVQELAAAWCDLQDGVDDDDDDDDDEDDDVVP